MSDPASRPLRVLFAPETFNLGETSRAVEVARAVQDAGHQVRFMGYSQRFAKYVTSAGFMLELLEPELSDADADRLLAVDQGRTIRHLFTTSMVRQRVDSELALIEQWRPHAIVIGTTLTLFLSARVAGVPLVYVRPYATSRSHLTTMTTFPLFTGTGRIKSLVNRLAAVGVRTAMSSLQWKPRSFRVVAAENGLHLPSRSLDAIDADLNLITSAQLISTSPPFASNERRVGPVYARSVEELPAEVLALTERLRPIVYVGLGSSANRSLALSLLRQLAPMNIDILTTAGSYLTDADRTTLTDNVHVYNFLPAHRLAGLIDAAVIHGGEGTVQTACASGVPFAGIALQSEQRFNIDECVRFGNALPITQTDLRCKRIPAIVTRLLHDTGLRRAALNAKARVSPLDGAEASAHEIIKLTRSISADQ